MAEGERFKDAQFLSHLIQGMADGVIFVDDKNTVRLCNPVGGSIRGVKGSGSLISTEDR